MHQKGKYSNVVIATQCHLFLLSLLVVFILMWTVQRGPGGGEERTLSLTPPGAQGLLQGHWHGYFMDKSTQSYHAMLQRFLGELGSDISYKKVNVLAVTRVPGVCSAPGFHCKALVYHKEAIITFLSPSYIPRRYNNVTTSRLTIQTRTPQLIISSQSAAIRTAPRRYIPLVHSETNARLAAEHLRTRTAPQVLPYFCHRSHWAPSSTPGEQIEWGTFALFPSKSEKFTNYFMEQYDQASFNLESSSRLDHLASIYNETAEDLNSYNIRGVVFPDAHIPEEVLNDFYCQNMPVFVPTVDINYLWRNGSVEQITALSHCHTSDIEDRFKTDLRVFDAYPQVITYNCFYDLTDKLTSTDTPKVARKMRQENIIKSKNIEDIVYNLKKHIT